MRVPARGFRAALVALLCALAAGCGGGGGDGGSSGTAPAEYAGSVCGAVQLWRTQLEDASGVLAQRLNQAKTLRAARRELVTFFDGAIAQTDRMLASVRAAGAPDVENGEALAADLVRRLEEFRPLLVRLRAEARKLPVDNEMRFATEAQTIGQPYLEKLGTLTGLLGDLDAQYDAPELSEAAERDPSCEGL